MARFHVLDRVGKEVHVPIHMLTPLRNATDSSDVATITVSDDRMKVARGKWA